MASILRIPSYGFRTMILVRDLGPLGLPLGPPDLQAGQRAATLHQASAVEPSDDVLPDPS